MRMCVTLILYHSLILSHSLYLSLSLCVCVCHTNSLSLSHYLSHSLFLSLTIYIYIALASYRVEIISSKNSIQISLQKWLWLKFYLEITFRVQ